MYVCMYVCIGDPWAVCHHLQGAGAGAHGALSVCECSCIGRLGLVDDERSGAIAAAGLEPEVEYVGTVQARALRVGRVARTVDAATKLTALVLQRHFACSKRAVICKLLSQLVVRTAIVSKIRQVSH